MKLVESSDPNTIRFEYTGPFGKYTVFILMPVVLMSLDMIFGITGLIPRDYAANQIGKTVNLFTGAVFGGVALKYILKRQGLIFDKSKSVLEKWAWFYSSPFIRRYDLKLCDRINCIKRTHGPSGMGDEWNVYQIMLQGDGVKDICIQDYLDYQTSRHTLGALAKFLGLPVYDKSIRDEIEWNPPGEKIEPDAAPDTLKSRIEYFEDAINITTPPRGISSIHYSTGIFYFILSVIGFVVIPMLVQKHSPADSDAGQTMFVCFATLFSIMLSIAIPRLRKEARRTQSVFIDEQQIKVRDGENVTDIPIADLKEIICRQNDELRSSKLGHSAVLPGVIIRGSNTQATFGDWLDDQENEYLCSLIKRCSQTQGNNLPEN